MNITPPTMTGPLKDVWPLLFQLAEDRPSGRALAGAQMVVLHAAHHGVARPLVTRDADILVDVRSLATTQVAQWLRQRGFELCDVASSGIGHRFRRGHLVVDVLALDHTPASNRTTVAPARTIEVPGGRRAISRTVNATVATATGRTGTIPLPDWLGAVLLKARAVVSVPDHRAKHCQDLALLLSLPIDIDDWVGEVAGRDRSHLRKAGALLNEDAWRAVAAAVDIRTGQAALRLLT